MKKFFNVSTVLLTMAFVIGLIAALFASNWVASIWILAGLFWMLMNRWQEVQNHELLEECEFRLAGAKKMCDDYRKQFEDYRDKYEAKLKENYDLSCENSRLSEVNQRLAKTVDDEALGSKTPDAHHGNIKLKRKSSGSTKV